MKFFDKIIKLTAEAAANIVLKKQNNLFKNVIINNINTNGKPLSDTVVFITYFIDVAGMSKSIVEQGIEQMIHDGNVSVTKEDLGVKNVTQLFLPIKKGASRIEITAI